MTSRFVRTWLPLAVLGLTVVAAAAVFFDPTYTLLGVLGREPFYRGRSATYWRRELLDRDPVLQASAAGALRDGGAEAVPMLVYLLNSSRGGDWVAAAVRKRSIELLGEIGPDARAAVSDLAAYLQRDEKERRRTADLAAVVGDKDPGVRRAALTALARIGPAANEALPEVEALRQDPDESVRRAAEQAVRAIAPK